MNSDRLKGWRILKPDWRVSLATIFFCALALTAANWQQDRAAFKAQLQARYDEQSAAAPAVVGAELVDPEVYDQRSVIVRGVYSPRYAVFLDNKVYNGRAGYQLLTPLRIEKSETYVLVNRGWVAQGPTRAQLPVVSTPSGVQEVEGIGVRPGDRFLELDEQTEQGALWQNLSLQKYRQWSGLRVQPVVIEQRSDAADGLIRDWPRPDFGIDKHRIYALQWYSFCFLALFLYVFFHIKRRD